MIADLESEVADLIGAGGSNASDRDSCTASSSSGCDSPRYRRQSRHVLEWHVAEASLGTSRRRKRVLKNIKGRVETGSFTILVGPSGSGKTTLLDCLARRHRHFVGTVCLNGRELHAPSFQQVAVIRPADCLWGYLTPREHLTFHALAASIHRASLHKAVEELLGLMGLEGCADVLVREVGKGERRRLHLATHLLANPAVLLLDDPTQGLDGPASSSLLHCLSSLSERGPPVLASLPLPLPSPPLSFTHAILLTCDGRQAFHGSQEELDSYVCSYLRLPLSCPSPFEALVRLLGPQPHETDAAVGTRLDHLVRAFDDSPWAPTTPAPLADQRPSDLLPNCRGADWLALLELNLARSFASVLRNHATCLRWIGAMFAACLLMGIAFHQVAPSDWRGVRWSVFLLTCASTLFASIIQARVLHVELPAIRNECGRGANAVGPYVLSKALFLTPVLLGAAGMAAVVYFGTGLGGKVDVSHVSCFVLLLGLHMAACSGLAALLASLFRRPTAPLLLVWVCFFLTSTATGLVPWQSLSLQWLHRVNLVDHTLCSLLGAQAWGLAPAEREPLLALCDVKPAQVPRMMLELWSVGLCLYVLAYMSLRLQHALDTRTRA